MLLGDHITKGLLQSIDYTFYQCGRRICAVTENTKRLSKASRMIIKTNCILFTNKRGWLALFDKILMVNNLECHNFTLLTLCLTHLHRISEDGFPICGVYNQIKIWSIFFGSGWRLEGCCECLIVKKHCP
eukprot:TRINITY_DN104509_c0_g1_i1.p1 TRINITY_DN104509_c0_g1~~TRINITY_DN104509_c0_g1_i1.p1  ORF type:complete len:130 (-),score=1.62 TRINITY_DN104509_c0_g1_i1:100-489(-)